MCLSTCLIYLFTNPMTQLNRSKLASLLQSEEQLFHKTHPKSYELYQRARSPCMAECQCFG